jgi:hypothetical protein
MEKAKKSCPLCRKDILENINFSFNDRSNYQYVYRISFNNNGDLRWIPRFNININSSLFLDENINY